MDRTDETLYFTDAFKLGGAFRPKFEPSSKRIPLCRVVARFC
jgi:hypothetical protein